MRVRISLGSDSSLDGVHVRDSAGGDRIPASILHRQKLSTETGRVLMLSGSSTAVRLCRRPWRA